MKLLLLQKRPLFPTDSGGKIRTLNIVRHLAQWHEVTYLCNVLPSEQSGLEPMRALGVRLEAFPWRDVRRGGLDFYRDLARNLFSSLPYTVVKNYDPRLRQRAAELLRTEPFDLLICDFVQMARHVLDLGGCPKLLLQHNVEAEILERHARQDRGWIRRCYMADQARKMRRFEARAGRAFDRVVAVSQRDRDVFQRSYGWNHVQAIDTAVDTAYFAPDGTAEQPGRVLFVGSLDWLPNVDGVLWFVREAWPLVRAAHPRASLQIVGRRPDASVRRLDGVDGVRVEGTVPDVRPYWQAASVVVVPLWVGGGTRLKIFEAMAMGKPVVSTTLGAEGLRVASEEHLRIGDSAAEFARQVNELLSDGAARRQLGERAQQLVRREYSSERVARQFESICLEVVAAARAPSAPAPEPDCHPETTAAGGWERSSA
ncbi:MAG: glycosyltransferase [Pirellulaceae bacterium]|nr:glycosyltransferase [Pirellulaceae bacterium]